MSAIDDDGDDDDDDVDDDVLRFNVRSTTDRSQLSLTHDMKINKQPIGSDAQLAAQLYKHVIIYKPSKLGQSNADFGL